MIAFSPGVLLRAPVAAPSEMIKFNPNIFIPTQKATNGGMSAPAIPISASQKIVSPPSAEITLVQQIPDLKSFVMSDQEEAVAAGHRLLSWSGSLSDTSARRIALIQTAAATAITNATTSPIRSLIISATSAIWSKKT